MKKIIYDILTLLVIIMVILEIPVFYYYTSGLSSLMIAIPYMSVGFGISIWLLIRMIKNNVSEFQKFGIIFTIVFAIFTILFGQKSIEYLDWHLRKDTRKEIIKLIKEGKLEPNVQKGGICKLNKWDCPPISNGGNEIIISGEKNKLTVNFFKDRGFLDNFSAFVYTEDSYTIRYIEKDSKYYKKLENNWYEVAF